MSMSGGDTEDFEGNPREFALELVDVGVVTDEQLLQCALKFMSYDNIRDMLDVNELSPRFLDPHFFRPTGEE